MAGLALTFTLFGFWENRNGPNRSVAGRQQNPASFPLNYARGRPGQRRRCSDETRAAVESSDTNTRELQTRGTCRKGCAEYKRGGNSTRRKAFQRDAISHGRSVPPGPLV